MISRDEILKGQNCPPDLESNLEALLVALNLFRQAYGHPMIVTSGLRSLSHNQSVGGRPGSAHVKAQAADFSDADHSLKQFCLANLSLLESCGLWMESPDATPTWVHLQTRPAHNRVFNP